MSIRGKWFEIGTFVFGLVMLASGILCIVELVQGYDGGLFGILLSIAVFFVIAVASFYVSYRFGSYLKNRSRKR